MRWRYLVPLLVLLMLGPKRIFPPTLANSTIGWAGLMVNNLVIHQEFIFGKNVSVEYLCSQSLWYMVSLEEEKQRKCLSPWLWAVNWQTSLLIRFYSYRWNELIFLIAQTTCAGIRKCASECSLLLVLDDNGSISKVCWGVLFRRSEALNSIGRNPCIDCIWAHQDAQCERRVNRIGWYILDVCY